VSKKAIASKVMPSLRTGLARGITRREARGRGGALT